MSHRSEGVLVVEDSETQALRLTSLLEAAGITTQRAATAEEALDLLGHSRPELIVIDFHLPSMHGDELCRHIRMNPATSDILVLILTEDTQDAIEQRGLESGADDHVPKSVDADELMARIQGLLRTHRRTEGALPGSQAAFFRRHRVVVVDDSPTFLEFLAQELRHEGYEIVTFTSGEDALEHVGRDGCDCILVDLVMPGIDGIELCSRLDGFRSRAGLWFPVLMVTGRDSKEDMMRALEAGADDFVSKSSDSAILTARIRALLRRKVQRDEHKRIGDEFRKKELEVVRERTEREAAERRAALVEKLEQTNRDLRETQAQLVQAVKMASLGELVAGIAHEVNNPLAYVMSHVDTVERDLVRLNQGIGDRASPALSASFERARTRLGDTRKGLERVRDLVLKLRNFSRLDEGEFKQVDLREGVESALTILHHRLADGVTLETCFAEDNVIWCYPAPLNQVVMNLLSNAIDAVDGEGTIEVRTERSAEEFHIVVADSGPGIAVEIRDRIFEPFFTTKPVGTGTGLGLAISYRIVQAHKGRLEVRDREGMGTEVAAIIPLTLGETTDAS